MLSSDDLMRERKNGEKSDGQASSYSSRQSGRAPAKKVRRHTHFGNPQSTWFGGGHMMTGGDSLLSVGLSVVLMLGMTGVWLGTTGSWLWKHGSEYGIAKGGGVAVVIIFV